MLLSLKGGGGIAARRGGPHIRTGVRELLSQRDAPFQDYRERGNTGGD